jgi:REP element-mobilizing transposase RayT
MRDSFLDSPKRKQNRLQGYDYDRPRYYFITVCAGKRAEFFWEAASMRCVGADIIRPFSPRLSQYGVYVEKAIQDIPQHYTGVKVDKYVVMPNHIHLILTLAWRSGRMISAPTKEIPIIVGQMKRVVSKKAGFPIWQKGYRDHIIRNEADYRRIWEYIDTNPAKWREDCYYEDGAE